MDVFFVDSNGRSHTTQASIRGTFRGKAKHSVYIDVGSIVMVGDTGVPGPCQYEIMAVLSQDDLRSIRKEMEIDSRILAVEVTDAEVLKKSSDLGEGYVFEDEEAPKEDDDLFEKPDDIDIDDI
jgi:hypothetical protein